MVRIAEWPSSSSTTRGWTPSASSRVAAVFDACSQRVVGWRTAAAMPTQLPLDALEMALWNRALVGQDVTGLIHHSDAGCPVHLDPLHRPVA